MPFECELHHVHMDMVPFRSSVVYCQDLTSKPLVVLVSCYYVL